mgnify:FL=1
MTEIIGMILIIGSGIFFRMGGIGLKPLGKGWRRFVLPLFLGTFAILTGFYWQKVGLAVLGSMVAFSLPYGEKYHYWIKFLVGCAFITPTLLLGYTLWQIIVPILFILLFKLSNWKVAANEFGWAICEILTGICIGITWARVLGVV